MCIAQPLRIDKNGCCLFCAKLPTAQSNRNSIRRQFFIFFSMAQFMRRNDSGGDGWNLRNAGLLHRKGWVLDVAAAVSVRCCTKLPLAMLQVSGTKPQSQDARHGMQLLLKMSHPPTVRNKEKTSNCLRLIDDSYWWALVPWAKQQKRTAGPGKTSQKFWWTISSYSCISSRLHDAFSSDIPSGSEWIFGAPEKRPFGEIKGSVPSEFNCERLVKQVRSRHLWFKYVQIRWLMAIWESKLPNLLGYNSSHPQLKSPSFSRLWLQPFRMMKHENVAGSIAILDA